MSMSRNDAEQRQVWADLFEGLTGPNVLAMLEMHKKLTPAEIVTKVAPLEGAVPVTPPSLQEKVDKVAADLASTRTERDTHGTGNAQTVAELPGVTNSSGGPNPLANVQSDSSKASEPALDAQTEAEKPAAEGSIAQTQEAPAATNSTQGALDALANLPPELKKALIQILGGSNV